LKILTFLNLGISLNLSFINLIKSVFNSFKSSNVYWSWYWNKPISQWWSLSGITAVYMLKFLWSFTLKKWKSIIIFLFFLIKQIKFLYTYKWFQKNIPKIIYGIFLLQTIFNYLQCLIFSMYNYFRWWYINNIKFSSWCYATMTRMLTIAWTICETKTWCFKPICYNHKNFHCT